MSSHRDKSQKSRKKGLFLLTLALLLAIVPLLVGKGHYAQHIATMVAVGIVLTLGVNLVFGYLGQINFGYHGFYCLGAYTFALLVVNLKIPFIPAIFLAILIVFFVALLIGIPLLRLRGHYLALGTLAMGLAVYVLANLFPHINGGEDGMVLSTPTIFGTSLRGIPLVYFLLVWVLICFYTCHCLMSSRLGRAILAIREDEEAALICGINVFWTKLVVFALSGSFGAIAGALWCSSVRFVQPEMFNLEILILLLAQMVIGGLGSNFGAVLGGTLVVLLNEYTSPAGAYQPLFFAGILLAALMFFPTGIAGLLKRLFIKNT